MIPQPLYAYNQLLVKERQQVSRPADEEERRYFLVGTAVYDYKEFTEDVDGMWFTNADRKVAVQQYVPGCVLVKRTG